MVGRLVGWSKQVNKFSQECQDKSVENISHQFPQIFFPSDPATVDLICICCAQIHDGCDNPQNQYIVQVLIHAHHPHTNVDSSIRFL